MTRAFLIGGEEVDGEGARSGEVMSEIARRYGLTSKG